MIKDIKILLVEGDIIDQRAFHSLVKNENLPYAITICVSCQEAISVLNNQTFDVIITNCNLGDGNVFDIQKNLRGTPVIIAAEIGYQEMADKAMKEGVYDYIIKDRDQRYIKSLPLIIDNAIKHGLTEKNHYMLSHTLMSISDGVIIANLSGEIIFVNNAFLTTFKCTRKDVIGKQFSILYSSSVVRNLYHKVITEAKKSGWKGELSCRRPNGGEFPASLSISKVYDDNRQPIAFASIVKDISDQKRILKELKDAKELAEASSESKSRFLANMSHEIRTPMNGIMGMIELSLDSDMSDDLKENVLIIKKSAGTLLTIINDILDFSKIEAGKFELLNTEFEFRSLINETVQAFQLLANQKRIGLGVNIDSGMPEKIIGDPVRLKQILVNLIGNALKFTMHGQVTIDVIIREINTQKITLQFSITDTGIGIPKESQKNIFRSFEQADSSTTKKFGGTGLGLAICAQLVEMMSGHIWVESPVKPANTQEIPEYGPGCSFQFEIKLETIEEINLTESYLYSLKQENGKPVEQPAERHLSILVAEDNKVNQKVAKKLLENMNHIVELVENGKEVIMKLEQGNKYDLIIMDVQMPLMDGLSATSLIRESEEGSKDHLPIIALTANAMKGDRELCLQAGMDEYVSKPISKNELIRAIQNVFRSEHKNASL